jgi:hypothetical protein
MSVIANQRFIPICCVCGLVRDEAGETGSGDDERWSDLGSYLDRHGLRGSDYRLTHTYCPVCVHRYASIGKSYEEESLSTRPGLTITGLILQTIRRRPHCNLDALVRACPQYTWNQIFLEVDRLSRTGEIELASAGHGQYTISMPDKRRAEVHKPVYTATPGE